jgi:hypothetical protein
MIHWRITPCDDFLAMLEKHFPEAKFQISQELNKITIAEFKKRLGELPPEAYHAGQVILWIDGTLQELETFLKAALDKNDWVRSLHVFHINGDKSTQYVSLKDRTDRFVNGIPVQPGQEVPGEDLLRAFGA